MYVSKAALLSLAIGSSSLNRNNTRFHLLAKEKKTIKNKEK